MSAETERDAIAEVVREEFRKAKDADGNPLVPEEPEPLTLNINGSQYKFKDKAELEGALGQTFSTFNQELTTRDAKLQAQQPPRKEGEYVTGKESETAFNQEEYINLMGKDILKANDYLLNHQIFGGRVPNAAEAIRQKLGDIEKQNATIAVYQFKELHPEFPLNEQATKVVDGLRRELGQSFTLQGLEAAYGVAQARGLLPSPAVAAYQKKLYDEGILKRDEGTGQQQQTNLGFQPPPGVSRSGNAPSLDLAAQAEQMSLTDLTKALRKSGLM